MGAATPPPAAGWLPTVESTSVESALRLVVVESILWLVSAALIVTLLALSLFTVGLSVRERRGDRTRERTRTSVRAELLERQRRSDPDWEGWVSDLSSAERAQLESVLERYLRLVDGAHREGFLAVADALELGVRAATTLDKLGLDARLRALSTLAVIDYPASVERLVETCTDSRETREVAARLLYERRREYDAPSEWGTALLLWDNHTPLSVYGLETLAALNTGPNPPLLDHASQRARRWDRPVLIQVCLVLEHCQVMAPNEAFEWLHPLLEDEEPAVRAAAIRAFKPQGWRRSLREKFDFASLVTDEDPGVRRATYEVLAYWGDRRARELLEWAVIDERDERCRLVAVCALASMDADPLRDHPEWPEMTWEWLRAEFETGERHRLSSLAGGKPK